MAKKVEHSSLLPYPTDISEPASILLKKLSGEEVGHNCCIHAAYQIQGVALGQLFPDDHDHSESVSKGVQSVKAPNDEEAKALLEDATKKRGPIADMILKQLLAFAIAKLNEWLNK